MRLPTDYEPEFESLKCLLLDMAQERSLDSLMHLVVSRMAERPHIARVSIWLDLPGDICKTCPMRERCPDKTTCLHLVDSAGMSIEEEKVNYSIRLDQFRRVPLGLEGIGQIFSSGESLILTDMDQEGSKVAFPDWLKTEEVVGFVAQPIIFKEKILGVMGIYLRITPDPLEGDGRIWSRLIADHTGAAIANARAFEEIESLSKFPSENPNPLFRVTEEGKVIYANAPAIILLIEWDSQIGGQIPSTFMEPIAEALKSDVNQEFEMELQRRIFAFEIMPTGRDYVNIYGRDITERRQAELALEKITLEKERIENELQFATLVQEGFLPDEPPRHKNYSFAAKTVPARFVGGDFYDFISIGDKQLGILLGDVSGKGVSAALYMARLMSDFRYITQVDPTPGTVMKNINDILSLRSRRGMFATAIYLLLDLNEKKLWVSNAGHHSILIRDRQNRFVEKGEAGGVPLGILPGTEYPQQEIQLHGGDLVFLYTDGVIEPKNRNNQSFGLEGLRNVIKKNQGSPQELISDLNVIISKYNKDNFPHDDLTCLSFKVF